MVLQDVTNTGPIHPHKRLHDQYGDLIQQIQLEHDLLQRCRHDTEERRLLLHIRHLEYCQHKHRQKFDLERRNLLHSHLKRKSELVARRKSEMDRIQEIYRKRVERLRTESKRNRLKADSEGHRSIQLVREKIMESNSRSMALLREQLQDSQSIVLNTFRSLESQVMQARSDQQKLEEETTELRNQGRRLLELKDDAERRLRETAGQFSNDVLKLSSVSDIVMMVDRIYQTVHKAADRSKAGLRQRALQLSQMQKQMKIYRRGLARVIAERDQLYHHFSSFNQFLSQENRRMEDNLNERFRDLSQRLVAQTAS